jgi:hypothetical protein
MNADSKKLLMEMLEESIKTTTKSMDEYTDPIHIASIYDLVELLKDMLEWVVAQSVIDSYSFEVSKDIMKRVARMIRGGGKDMQAMCEYLNILEGHDI